MCYILYKITIDCKSYDLQSYILSNTSLNGKANTSTVNSQISTLNSRVPSNVAWGRATYNSTADTCTMIASHGLTITPAGDKLTFIVNLSPAFPDANYAAFASFEISGTGEEIFGVYGYTTNSFMADCKAADDTTKYPSIVSVMAIR